MNSLRSLLWIGPCDDLVLPAADPRLDVTWVEDPEEALGLPPLRFDAALLDLGGDAVRALRQLRRVPAFPPVIARLRDGAGSATESVRRLLDAGATDVLWAPAGPDAEGFRCELLDRLDRLPGGTQLADAEAVPEVPGVHCASPAMAAVLRLVERAAHTQATALLSGETGTGKEVLARAIHRLGPRRERPFVAVNCAAFPDTLLESELFGHRKGAFTGADRDKPGLFEAAHQGTLFLDEIGETSLPLQAKLLRALQEREIRPVGGTRSRQVDVRVIAATHRDLHAEASRGPFREDLYYRLAVFPIRVPPLRERRGDVLPLARHFLEHHGRREGRAGCRLSRAAEHLLLAYHWPGNVRELENEIQRVLALAEPGEILSPRLLSERLTGAVEAVEAPASRDETLRQTLDRVEAFVIRRTLERNGGQKAASARQLGVTREGLYKKMKRLGIE